MPHRTRSSQTIMNSTIMSYFANASFIISYRRGATHILSRCRDSTLRIPRRHCSPYRFAVRFPGDIAGKDKVSTLSPAKTPQCRRSNCTPRLSRDPTRRCLQQLASTPKRNPCDVAGVGQHGKANRQVSCPKQGRLRIIISGVSFPRIEECVCLLGRT